MAFLPFFRPIAFFQIQQLFINTMVKIVINYYLGFGSQNGSRTTKGDGMHHATPLITTIVGGLVLAFILGMIANKLRISPLVGYLLAGVLAGPFTPGFVADTKLAPELAELGVILLMFGVGLHFSLKDLMAVKSIAIPGAIAQIAVATLLGMALSAPWLVADDRHRLWPVSLHRQYRGAAARLRNDS
jgi:CPA2 family monovalent cation:H+ antiporter-2